VHSRWCPYGLNRDGQLIGSLLSNILSQHQPLRIAAKEGVISHIVSNVRREGNGTAQRMPLSVSIRPLLNLPPQHLVFSHQLNVSH